MSGLVYLVSHPKAGGDVVLRVLEAAQRYMACHAELATPPAVADTPAVPLADLRRSFNDLQSAVREMNRRFSEDDGRTMLDALAACGDRGRALALTR